MNCIFSQRVGKLKNKFKHIKVPPWEGLGKKFKEAIVAMDNVVNV